MALDASIYLVRPDGTKWHPCESFRVFRPLHSWMVERWRLLHPEDESEMANSFNNVPMLLTPDVLRALAQDLLDPYSTLFCNVFWDLWMAGKDRLMDDVEDVTRCCNYRHWRELVHVVATARALEYPTYYEPCF